MLVSTFLILGEDYSFPDGIAKLVQNCGGVLPHNIYLNKIFTPENIESAEVVANIDL